MFVSDIDMTGRNSLPPPPPPDLNTYDHLILTPFAIMKRQRQVQSLSRVCEVELHTPCGVNHLNRSRDLWTQKHTQLPEFPPLPSASTLPYGLMTTPKPVSPLNSTKVPVPSLVTTKDRPFTPGFVKLSDLQPQWRQEISMASRITLCTSPKIHHPIHHCSLPTPHIPRTVYHPPSNTFHAPFTPTHHTMPNTYRVPPTTYHSAHHSPPPIPHIPRNIYRSPPNTSHAPPTPNHRATPTTYHIPPTIHRSALITHFPTLTSLHPPPPTPHIPRKIHRPPPSTFHAPLTANHRITLCTTPRIHHPAVNRTTPNTSYVPPTTYHSTHHLPPPIPHIPRNIYRPPSNTSHAPLTPNHRATPTTYHIPPTIHRPALITHFSTFTSPHSPPPTPHMPRKIHRPPPNTFHVPLAANHRITLCTTPRIHHPAVTAYHSPPLTPHIPRNIYHPPLSTFHAPLTANHRTTPTTYHIPPTTYPSALTTQLSNTHHSPFTTHPPTLITPDWPLNSAYTPATLSRIPPIALHLPLTTCHSTLTTH